MADTVRIEGVPARTWWRLATTAERRGIRVVDLLDELSLTASREAAPEPRPASASTGELVAQHHAAGLSDGQIGRLLHCSSSTVLYHRRRQNLPANRGHGRAA